MDSQLFPQIFVSSFLILNYGLCYFRKISDSLTTGYNLIIIIKSINMPEEQKQQFELKLAVCHHPTLKTEQLIQFLQSQSNQFLSNDFPQSITQDRFITLFQPLPSVQTSTQDFSQFIGLLLLYSTSILDSFQYVKKRVPANYQKDDLFIIVVEMDNTDKKTNVVGDEGERLCAKIGCQFVRLSLFNSQDLVACLHKNLYQLIQNYYYPNEQQRPPKKTNEPQYIFHYTPEQEAPDHQNSITTNQIQSPLANKKQEFSQSQKKERQKEKQIQRQAQRQRQRMRILATKQQRKSYQKLLEKASQLRQSRNIQIIQEQKQIDESIENVEKVLMKINQNISSKLHSNWYTSLNHTLYSPLQKNSISYSKIKLTQQFIDNSDSETQNPDYLKLLTKKSTQSRQPARPQRTAFINKFIAKHRKLQPILKLLLTVSDSVIVELDVHQQTQYHELTLIALKKMALAETEKNYQLMRRIIVNRIQQFVKELTKAVKITQKIRIDERSFLRPLSNGSSSRNLYRSGASVSSSSKAD